MLRSFVLISALLAAVSARTALPRPVSRPAGIKMLEPIPAPPHREGRDAIKAARDTQANGGKGTPAQVWFDKMDKDGDGTISVSEFLRGYDALEQQLSPPARQSIAVAAERMIVNLAQSIVANNERDERKVEASLTRLKGDLEELDFRAGQNLKLTESEIFLLTALTALSFGSPALFAENVAEVMIPSLAAISAALGLTFEYVGKVAVAGGKEVGANAEQVAAESEQMLAAAERTKAVLPLCVGVSASAVAFALLAPALLEAFLPNAAVLVSAEFFFICPVLSILSAAIGALAAEDTGVLCNKAKSVGERRFATRADVQTTWLSVTERVSSDSVIDKRRWINFALNVLPAPFLATAFPGGLGEKCVVASALAAAQAAYHLACAEYQLAIATDAVAVKTRIAAVANTYANQGMRAGALLPFTSALGGLCVAIAAFVVEINPVAATIFPALASVFAAAASVAKARCEIDFGATNAAASELAKKAAEPSGGRDDDYFLRPIKGVQKLIKTVAKTVWAATKTSWTRFQGKFSQVFGGNGPTPSPA